MARAVWWWRSAHPLLNMDCARGRRAREQMMRLM